MTERTRTLLEQSETITPDERVLLEGRDLRAYEELHLDALLQSEAELLAVQTKLRAFVARLLA